MREGLSSLKEWYLAQNKTPEELLESEIVQNWQPAEVASHG